MLLIQLVDKISLNISHKLSAYVTKLMGLFMHYMQTYYYWAIVAFVFTSIKRLADLQDMTRTMYQKRTATRSTNSNVRFPFKSHRRHTFCIEPGRVRAETRMDHVRFDLIVVVVVMLGHRCNRQ